MPRHRYSISPRLLRREQWRRRFTMRGLSTIRSITIDSGEEAHGTASFVDGSPLRRILSKRLLPANNGPFFAHNNNPSLYLPLSRGKKARELTCMSITYDIYKIYIYIYFPLAISLFSAILSCLFSHPSLSLVLHPPGRHCSSIVRERQEKDSIKS